ncbi:MAG: hypothetical protein GXN93_05335 [Candidatus Diapherotrites archaeon]|nr:hypothetical protein [Candidatus Diapherotrites archaeon]
MDAVRIAYDIIRGIRPRELTDKQYELLLNPPEEIINYIQSNFYKKLGEDDDVKRMAEKYPEIKEAWGKVDDYIRILQEIVLLKCVESGCSKILDKNEVSEIRRFLKSQERSYALYIIPQLAIKRIVDAPLNVPAPQEVTVSGFYPVVKTTASHLNPDLREGLGNLVTDDTPVTVWALIDEDDLLLEVDIGNYTIIYDYLRASLLGKKKLHEIGRILRVQGRRQLSEGRPAVHMYRYTPEPARVVRERIGPIVIHGIWNQNKKELYFRAIPVPYTDVFAGTLASYLNFTDLARKHYEVTEEKFENLVGEVREKVLEKFYNITRKASLFSERELPALFFVDAGLEDSGYAGRELGRAFAEASGIECFAGYPIYRCPNEDKLYVTLVESGFIQFRGGDIYVNGVSVRSVLRKLYPERDPEELIRDVVKKFFKENFMFSLLPLYYIRRVAKHIPDDSFNDIILQFYVNKAVRRYAFLKMKIVHYEPGRAVVREEEGGKEYELRGSIAEMLEQLDDILLPRVKCGDVQCIILGEIREKSVAVFDVDGVLVDSSKRLAMAQEKSGGDPTRFQQLYLDPDNVIKLDKLERYALDTIEKLRADVGRVIVTERPKELVEATLVQLRRTLEDATIIFRADDTPPREFKRAVLEWLVEQGLTIVEVHDDDVNVLNDAELIEPTAELYKWNLHGVTRDWEKKIRLGRNFYAPA